MPEVTVWTSFPQTEGGCTTWRGLPVSRERSPCALASPLHASQQAAIGLAQTLAPSPPEIQVHSFPLAP